MQRPKQPRSCHATSQALEPTELAMAASQLYTKNGLGPAKEQRSSFVLAPDLQLSRTRSRSCYAVLCILAVSLILSSSLLFATRHRSAVKMRPSTLISLLAAAGSSQGIRILQSNDDGWAESYLREMHSALLRAGHDALVSAPAENQSGTASRDAEPKPRAAACQFDSCPAASGPVGSNATDPRLNWVNSFPVTSIKYGFHTFGPQLWGPGAGPDLVVTGPNIGSNLWLQVPFSGTIGAAAESVRNHGVPALAFSGFTATHAAWSAAPAPPEAILYAELALKLTTAVVASGAPYLPAGVFLATNFPRVSSRCSKVDDFQFVLTRINPGGFTGPDAPHCGGDTRLPTETEVVLNPRGCYVSVSVADAADKTTAPSDKQAAVLEKLGDFLTCYD
ncbi:5'/3'-nucleotidase [Microdochium nivale]|nr:5'/3'-nucleotidase [Microdochium nivale]